MKKFPKVDSGILQWVDKHRIKNSKGDRFEWVEHNFLLEPMCDWSRRIAIRKSAQIGFSESFGVLKAVYGALNYKWNVIYTLPTDNFADGFSRTKLTPMLEANRELGKVVTGGVGVKEVGNRFIHFRGTYNTRTQDIKAESDKAISISSDLNIHDERDRSDQFTIDQYESRLENSDYGGVWSFSNPTYPKVGTDKLYEESDQKIWTVKCDHCGHWQYLDWIKLGEVEGVVDHCLIDAKNAVIRCGKCQKIIDENNRFHGEWVPTYPGRDVSGYWMSQLNYVRHKLGDIDGRPGLLSKEKKLDKQTFYNFMLGKPYRGTDITVTREVIVKNIVMNLDTKHGRCALGVDNGKTKWYVLGDEKGIFKIGYTTNWDEIENLIQTYQPYTIIDGNPYPEIPRKLAEKYPNVYLAFYKRDKDQIDAYEFRRKQKSVHIQRTKYFDILVDKFANKNKPINLTERELEAQYIKHWETLSRIETTDSQGITRGEWISSTGQDHFAHATVYQDIAATKIQKKGSDADSPAVVRSYDIRAAIDIDERGRGGLPTLDEILEFETNPGYGDEFV